MGRRAPGPLWFCYEDAGYKHLPGLLAWRVAKLFRSGLWPTPAVVPVRPDMAAKRAAIEQYKSQLAPLEQDHLLRSGWRPTCPSSTGGSTPRRRDGSA